MISPLYKNMKPIMLGGIYWSFLVLALLHAINWNLAEKGADIGPIHATAEKQERFAFSNT